MNILDSIIIEFDIINHTYQKLDIHDFEIDYNNKSKIYWIHSDLNNTALHKSLIKKLHLPEAVVLLNEQDNIMPKLLETDNALTVQVQCLLSDDLEEDSDNLLLYLTHHYCFTASKNAIPALTEFSENFSKAVPYAKTPCFILFILLDNVVNDYAKKLFDLEVVTEEMEISMSNKKSYQEIMQIKLKTMKIKRYSTALEEILMRISGRKIAVVSEQCQASLNGLFGHCQMLVNEADSIRDMLNGLLDQIDNALMQQMNETMRVLTAFAAIFLPLTLITGIYGMNFHWMPELTWKYGYFYALTLIFVCGIVLYFIFKKKKWF